MDAEHLMTSAAMETGLHELATEVGRGVLADRRWPDLTVQLVEELASPEAVEAVAGRYGVPVREYPSVLGCRYVAAEVRFGPGDPRPVVLRVFAAGPVAS